MAFRAVRTVSLLSLVFFLAACDGGADSTPEADGTPEADMARETVTQEAAPPGPRDVDHPPDYRVARLDCKAVGRYADSAGYTTTNRIDITRSGRDLRVTPANPVVTAGEEIRWVAEDMDATIRFMGRSPFGSERMVVSGSAGEAFPADERAMVAESQGRCGRYFYLVAAYDPEADSVFVADPPIWIRY